ncbi:MAG: nickel pincer cofactor biosynthesis protein LarB [Candidatus Omnitrophica bacterium]|nr:nickel pincer cofactor biosynthesis protein LarB [Candidatus Omnitrophota bacterium]
MGEDRIKKILNGLGSGDISVDKAFNLLRDLPYKDLGFAKVDHHRAIRRGFPEVVYCEGKSLAHIRDITAHLIKKGGPVLLTRASRDVYEALKEHYPRLRYNELARAVYCKGRARPNKRGLVLIVTAGTSDIPVAEEARVTLDVMGNNVKVLYDVGVAGIHRLLDKKKLLNRAGVIIVVAGMEGALASVVSGLVSRPVVAVPTSVGYGASFKGLSALLTMLNCCSPGVVAVNIDNGFGAGYFASLINK